MRTLVGIASIPERLASLERTVASLAPQADLVHVALNGYEHVPETILQHPNVIARVMPDPNGGDAEKFMPVDDWDGIVATCDDDILYPPDYITTLKAGLQRYPGRIVGFHGGKTLGWNGSAKAASHKTIRCLGSLEADDVDVNVLGTGALAYETARVPVWRGVFRNPNMADVHLACHARTFGIEMAALAHEEGWLTSLSAGPGIYESNKRRDGSRRDTTVLRERELGAHDWRQPTGKPSVRVSVATCERPHLLPDLLDDLEREARWLNVDVTVYDDASTVDYRVARAQVERNGWRWQRFSRRLGKEGHWRLVDRELRDCQSSAADWFVFLPDDVRLVRHAIPRAIDTWQRLQDPATLTLWRLKDHEWQTNWTGRVQEQHEHGWEVFHVDGIYLCKRELPDFFQYRLPPLRPTRRTSSGVGRAMSLRLYAAGKHMYRVDSSLAIPVKGEPSVMNPAAGDRIYPGIAI